MMEAIAIIGFYLMAYRTYRVTAKKAIKEIKTNFKYYPKCYRKPHRWIRKHFQLGHLEIPNFIILRLYIAILFLILAPIFGILSIIPQFKVIIFNIAVLIPVIIVFSEGIVFMILWFHYKRK